MSTTNQDYYVNNRDKMIKDFNKFSKHMIVVLKKQFNSAEVSKIVDSSRDAYDKLLPEIPYIGGFKNSGTKNLTGSAIILAYIKVLEKYNLTEREIGAMIYQFFEVLFKPKNKLIKAIIKQLLKRKFVKKILAKSFQRKAVYNHFDAAWHTEFVECNSDQYEFGIDIKQCGICKFFKAQNMEKYTKYMCLGDFPMLHAFGLNLYREKTVATSGEVCNYRINFSNENERAWPPEKMPEWPK